jgi:hypothetical protein
MPFAADFDPWSDRTAFPGGRSHDLDTAITGEQREECSIVRIPQEVR